MSNGNFGWLLIALGLMAVAVGAVWLLVPNLPRLGRLPGDLLIERGNSRFYFPITTCLLLSAVLSLVLWIVRWFGK